MNNANSKNIPVNKGVVEKLYAEEIISAEARKFALDSMYPRKWWQDIAEKNLTSFGFSYLILGMLGLFTINFNQLTPLFILLTMLCGIATSIVIANFLNVNSLSRKFLILLASLLIGLFIAKLVVTYDFSKVSFYQLALIWLILISGWTFVSNFSIQWVFAGFLLNLAIISWWLENHDIFDIGLGKFYTLFSYLVVINGVVLMIRENLNVRFELQWLNNILTRALPLFYILSLCSAPLLTVLSYPYIDVDYTLKINAIIGALGICFAYFYYRWCYQNLLALSLIVFTMSCILLSYSFRLYLHYYSLSATAFLFAGILIMLVFTLSYSHLKAMALKIKNGDN